LNTNDEAPGSSSSNNIYNDDEMNNCESNNEMEDERTNEQIVNDKKIIDSYMARISRSIEDDDFSWAFMAFLIVVLEAPKEYANIDQTIAQQLLFYNWDSGTDNITFYEAVELMRTVYNEQEINAMYNDYLVGMMNPDSPIFPPARFFGSFENEDIDVEFHFPYDTFNSLCKRDWSIVIPDDVDVSGKQKYDTLCTVRKLLLKTIAKILSPAVVT
jgi:hypothetical protein